VDAWVHDQASADLPRSGLSRFDHSTLRIPDRVSFLVGPNNSGKTSALRILDWALNRAEEETLMGHQALTANESALLIPATSTGGRGRRLTLGIRVDHRGSQRRYDCLTTGGIASLRIGTTAAGRVRVNLGPPARGEIEADPLALELLQRLRERTVFTLIPASRDAASETFRAALRAAALARIAERALHTRHAGTYAEYRNTKKALDAINEVATDLLAPLWEDIERVIPRGMAESAAVRPDVDPSALVAWLADRTVMRLVTGPHDVAGVPAVEVGAGLQSLLELAINRAGGAAEDVDWIIGLEEPEAFLHPSAQRAFARNLATDNARIIVSTHSPVVVDEARFGEVVLVRDHRFYYPREPQDPTRGDINSALLTGGGAEMLFARSVLFVEGPGDRAFFEELRRRVATEGGLADADALWTIAVGGKDFSAWLRLLRGFGEVNDRPIQWRVVADDDAAGDVLQAYRRAGHALRVELREVLEEIAGEYAATGASAETETLVARANELSMTRPGSPQLLAGALESAMISSAASPTLRRISALLGPTCPTDRPGLVGHLRADKAKWKRTLVARELPWHELDSGVRTALERWLSPVVGLRTARRTMDGLVAVSSAGT
jgi:AAA ATPase domain